MELKKPKPVHLKCPKCSYDFSYNANHIEEQIDTLKAEITTLKSQMAQFKQNNQNYYKAPAYKRMQTAMQEKTAQLMQYKKARKASNIEISMQVNTIFRGLIRDRIGEEETNKLLREAEDMMQYYVYDNAKQTFTRFERA